jgi:DNA recombination protein RmuC
MDPLLLYVLAGAVALVVAAVLLTRHLVRTRAEAVIARKDAELSQRDAEMQRKEADLQRAATDLAGRDRDIAVLREQLEEKDRIIADARQDKADSVALLKENYNRTVDDLKAAHEKALGDQLAALRHEMSVRTEEILKAREESLKASAETSFKTSTGALDENVRAMKEAFEKNKEAHTASTASLRTQLESAVGDLQRQAVSIGSKADSLADAMRGNNKVQGDWGEVVLENLFIQEGLTAPRDYETQETLRDEAGRVVVNEDTASRMRPDFILHYPDGYDIIVDSKVNLSAYYDWCQAADDSARDEAAQRHLLAIRRQVEGLARKDYSHYLAPDHKRIDFVVMFVPIYPALRLACESDHELLKWARSQNVLVTTEETIMPFLRVIKLAWTNLEQVQNQQLIVTAAENMISRVADFCKDYQAVGTSLENALGQFHRAEVKLRTTGPSIVTSARQVVAYGVRQNPKKPLPAPIGPDGIVGVDGLVGADSSDGAAGLVGTDSSDGADSIAGA